MQQNIEFANIVQGSHFQCNTSIAKPSETKGRGNIIRIQWKSVIFEKYVISGSSACLNIHTERYL